ncbi:MAG: ISNCY family transposase [Proteobacteria bacterium]|nr:ISNCY family transposase [Pseudomonadota bacterium]
MRNKIRKQLRLVEPSIHHEHARELYEMRGIISEHPEVLDIVHEDLIRGLCDPDAGRIGMMTAEQVFMALLIKQMNGFSYRVLAYHLEDSRTYRSFCGFGIGDVIPSESTIQRDIKKIRPETLEKINRIILGVASDKAIEKGRKVRVDCTVVESNIHHPTDSSLLYDSVKALCRLTQRAKERYDMVVSDHRRRAKKRALGILNAKRNKVRKELYRDLLKVTRKTVNDAERVATELMCLSTTDMVAVAKMATELRHYIPLAHQVISQTERRVFNGELLSPDEKLVSIFEPHTDIIRKDRRETYYGHKIVITGGVSGLLTDLVIEKGNPADSTIGEKMILRQKVIYGRVPRQAAFDGGFASKDNLRNIKKLGVKDVSFAKKCGLKVSDMTKSTWVYKRLRNFRAGIEGMISFLKRCCGLTRCTWRSFESFKAYAWSSVVTANLLLMARRMLA